MIVATIVGVSAFFLGLLAGCLSCSHIDPIGSLTYDLEIRRRQEAEYKLHLAEEEIARGSCRIRGHYFHYKCPVCHPHYLCYVNNGHICQEHRMEETRKYYAIDKERQDLVDLITKGQKSAAQLAKELDLSLPK